MDRQFPPAGGTGFAARQANGCGGFRARDFRRSATLRWVCVGFETDNLDGSPPGCAARQRSLSAQKMNGERMASELQNEMVAAGHEARLLRFARNDAQSSSDLMLRRPRSGRLE